MFPKRKADIFWNRIMFFSLECQVDYSGFSWVADNLQYLPLLRGRDHHNCIPMGCALRKEN